MWRKEVGGETGDEDRSDIGGPVGHVKEFRLHSNCKWKSLEDFKHVRDII